MSGLSTMPLQILPGGAHPGCAFAARHLCGPSLTNIAGDGEHRRYADRAGVDAFVDQRDHANPFEELL